MKYIIENLISFMKINPKVIHDISSTKIHDKVLNFMSVNYVCQSCWLKKPCLRRPSRAEIIAIDLLRRKKLWKTQTNKNMKEVLLLQIYNSTIVTLFNSNIYQNNHLIVLTEKLEETNPKNK